MPLDRGAALLRRLGVGVSDAIGIDVTFDGIEQSTDEMALVHQWEEPLRFGGRDEFEIHAERAAAGPNHLQPIEALWRTRQHDAAREMDAAALARFILDLAIELDRILLQAGSAWRHH